jgi:protein O-mannosyl-transferase
VPAKKHLFIISLLLALATFIAFWQVTYADFINYDDWNYVAENSHIQNGLTLEGIEWAYTTGYASNWHPLTWISHMVDVQLFGLQPGWHHLTNLLFHLVNTVLLFLVLHQMTKALWRSVFVVALFALHPLHVESVAWVAERKDVLSTFFWMLTMGMYVSYVGRPRLARYVGLLCCFALGLMAKPMLVTLPFVLLLLDYWPLQRLGQKNTAPHVKAPVQVPISQWSLIPPLLTEKIPFFALATLSSIVTYLVQRHGGAMEAFEALSPSARIANAFVSYITYMVKMLWPVNLAVLYPHPTGWPLWQVLGSVVILIAITVVAIRGIKKRPYVAVGWLWYVGTLVPVIGIVQVGMQAMADRCTYVPLIGLFIIVAWGVPDLLKKWSFRKEALIALPGLCLLFLFLLTWRQVGYWQNSIALYDHTLKSDRS